MAPFNLKDPIRRKIKQHRAQLSPRAIQSLSLKINHGLISLPSLKGATKIGFYMPFKGEVDPGYFVRQSWGQHKKFYLPVIRPDAKLSFVYVDKHTQLVKNRFGILEPKQGSNCLDAHLLDAIICPLVAFDAHGHRLGMGAGYYDKTLAFKRKNNYKPILVGLAYDFQLYPYVPNHCRDVPLNFCITPTRTYHFK